LTDKYTEIPQKKTVIIPLADSLEYRSVQFENPLSRSETVKGLQNYLYLHEYTRQSNGRI